MLKGKIDTSLLLVNLRSFCYYGGVGVLWPYLQVLARQYSISPPAVGITFGVASLASLGFLVILSKFKPKLESPKKLISLLVSLQFLIFGGLFLFHQHLKNSEFSSFHKHPVGLWCEGGGDGSQTLYLQQCQNQTEQSCFQKENLRSYFEPEAVLGFGDWFAGKDTLRRLSQFEFCEGRCEKIDIQREFQPTQNYNQSSSELEKLNFKIDTTGIRRNETCTRLPVKRVTSEDPNFSLDCPTGASISRECFIDCRRNKMVNLVLEEKEVIKLEAKEWKFWVFTALIGGCFVCMTLVVFLMEGLRFHKEQKKRAWGSPGLWGVLGWGTFAWISGFLTDYWSEGRPMKDYTPAFYCSMTLIAGAWLLFVFTDSRFMPAVRERFLRKYSLPKRIMFVFACTFVGITFGLQSCFLFWFMDDLAENHDDDSCTYQRWMRLVQGSMCAIETFGVILIHFLAGSFFRSLDKLHSLTFVLLIQGVRFLFISFITVPWVLVPFGSLQGIKFGILCMALSRVGSTKSGYSAIVPISAFCLGFAIGSVVSGFLLDTISTKQTFMIFGFVIVGVSLLLVIAKCFIHGKPRVAFVDERRRTSCFEVQEQDEDSEGDRKSSLSTKFYLLLWKNFTIQKRHKLQSSLEFLIPILVIAVLVGIRIYIPKTRIMEPAVFEPFALKGNAPAVIRTRTNQIFYTPANPFTDKIMVEVITNFFGASGLNYSVRSFPTEEEMELAYQGSLDGHGRSAISWRNISSPVLAGIRFDISNEDDGAISKVNYTLRFPAAQRTNFDFFPERTNFKSSWFTELLTPVYKFPGPRSPHSEAGGFPGYWEEGFLYLQYAIDSSITKQLLNSSQAEEFQAVQLKLRRFPYPPYVQDNFMTMQQLWMGVFLVAAFVYPAMSITRRIVYEKEMRLKQFLIISSFPNWLHWAAWVTSCFVYLLVLAIILKIMMKIPFIEDQAIFNESDGSLALVLLISSSVTFLGYCFLISSLFASATSASVAAGFFWIACILPYGYILPRVDTFTRGEKYATSLLLPTAPIFYACQMLATLEQDLSGLQWDTLFKGVSPSDGFSIFDCIVLMLVNGAFYMALALYIELVWPGKLGEPFPWYFPLTKWYWTTGIQKSKAKTDPVTNNGTNVKSKPDFFEPAPEHLKVGINVSGLDQAFGKTQVLKNLHLKAYEHQVTALVGRNEGGKTTLVSILTGQVKPADGVVTVNERDVITDVWSCRERLGFCPQNFTLFNELTVEEHLRFFARMRGYSPTQADQEVDRILDSLGLESEKDELVNCLNAGQKGKLLVGVAFCGGSKTVLLDEPTLCMDPRTRGIVWEFIQNEKIGRTVLLASNCMEEVEALGDRICILDNGTVKSSGSASFLKKKFGADHYLLIFSNRSLCNVDSLKALIKESVTSAFIIEDNSDKLRFLIPDECSQDFPGLLSSLEERKEEMRVTTFSLKRGTMDVVFMHASSLQEPSSKTSDQPANKRKAKGDADSESLLHYNTIGPKNERYLLLIQQFKAMAGKKMLYCWRNREWKILQMVVPVLLMFTVLVLLMVGPGLHTPLAKPISLSAYEALGAPWTLLSCNNTSEICRGHHHFLKERSYNVEEVSREDTLREFMLDKQVEDLYQVRAKYIVGFEQHPENPSSVVAWFNNQFLHSPALSLNLVSNGILKAFGVQARISVTNHPFPYINIEEIKQTTSFYTEGFIISWFLAVAMSLQGASYILLPIFERKVGKTRHLQKLAGIPDWIYWAGAYVVDLVTYLVPGVLIVLLMVCFCIEAFWEASTVFGFLTLCFFHGWAIISMMNLWSLCFSIPSTGYATMAAFNGATGFASMLLVRLLQDPKFELEDWAENLDYVLLISPSYSLGMGLVQLFGLHSLKQHCGKFDLGKFCQTQPDFYCCNRLQSTFLNWYPYGIGRNIFMLFVMGLVFKISLAVCESKMYKCMSGGPSDGSEWEPEDDNLSCTDRRMSVVADVSVVEEAGRVNGRTLEELSRTDTFVIKDLSKYYKKEFAVVDSLSFGIRKREIFGVVGLNGSGKTTLAEILSGLVAPSTGDAFLKQQSIQNGVKNLGYCPQTDGLIEELTGAETIRLFCNIKGIKEEYADRIEENLAEILNLTELLDTRVGTYSTSTRRRLSVAIALIGNPAVIILDEPTRGLDPIGKHRVWKALTRLRSHRTSVLISSQNMEECQTLCSRVAIMANGRFLCLGPPSNLQTKFAQGYIANVRLNLAGEDVAQESLDFRNLIQAELPEAVMVDSHEEGICYQIPAAPAKLVQIFTLLETARDNQLLQAYALEEMTLETVFNNVCNRNCRN